MLVHGIAILALPSYVERKKQPLTLSFFLYGRHITGIASKNARMSLKDSYLSPLSIRDYSGLLQRHQCCRVMAVQSFSFPPPRPLLLIISRYNP